VSECSDCKFWTPYGEDLDDHYFRSWDIVYAESDEQIEWADAVAAATPHPPTPWGTCRREHERPTPMFTNDGSGYFSALRTRHDFGCVAFEDKTPDTTGDQ